MERRHDVSITAAVLVPGWNNVRRRRRRRQRGACLKKGLSLRCLDKKVVRFYNQTIKVHEISIDRHEPIINCVVYTCYHCFCALAYRILITWKRGEGNENEQTRKEMFFFSIHANDFLGGISFGCIWIRVWAAYVSHKIPEYLFYLFACICGGSRFRFQSLSPGCFLALSCTLVTPHTSFLLWMQSVSVICGWKRNKWLNRL